MDTQQKQDQIAQYLAEIKKKKSTGAPISRRSLQTLSLLSFGQERLWFLHQLEKDSSAYNRPTILRFRGKLNLPLFKTCIHKIIERQEALRTVFPIVDGEPMAKVVPTFNLDFPVDDLSAYPAFERLEAATQKMGTVIDLPFNLETGPIVRVALFQLEVEEFLFLFVAHHIVFDAWSETIFINEIAAMYETQLRGEGNSIPNPIVQYADFAEWQRNRTLDEKFNHTLAYWKEKLDGLPVLNLPLDFPRPPIQTFSGRSVQFDLPKRLYQSLKQISRQEGVTLFMILLTGTLILLHRYTNEPDIVVGTPIAGRERKEVEKTIGLFIRTLALRSEMGRDATFKQYLSQVRKLALEAYTHSEVPFERIVEELRPDRSLAQTPVYQVLFNLENIPAPVSQMDDIQIDRLKAETKTVQYDLTMELYEIGESIQGHLEYNTDLFKEETIQRMAHHYLFLLEKSIENLDQKIATLSMMEDAEYDRIVHEWNDTLAPYSEHSCLHQLFEKQVEETPKATAIVFGQERVTYAGLNGLANRMARFLKAHNVGRGSRVGIFIPKSPEMVASIIAVMKTGATYVPLDPSFPIERLQAITIDSQIDVILDGFPGNHPFNSEKCSVIPLEKILDLSSNNDSTNLCFLSDPDDIIYIVYTSGTMGAPKGVPISHRSVVNYLEYFSQLCKLNNDDIVLQIPPISFDAAVEDIFGTLISGGKLALLPDEAVTDMNIVMQVIEQEEISCILSTVPSFWRAFTTYTANHELRNQTVRLITISGEVLYASDCERLWEIFGPHLELINTYGPTETTIITTSYKIPKTQAKDKPVLIGKPIQNTQIYILDENFCPVPQGVVGEICVGGIGLALGYLNQPGLTAEKFIPHPFHKQPGSRLFRTGDQGRFLTDGIIELLGRTDRMVKIRGNRVEIGEVEAVLSSHESVGETAVIATPGVQSETELIAYITPADQEEQPDVTELRHFLQGKLPNYMIPSLFILVKTLPRNPNGKIKYQELPPPDRKQIEVGSTYAKPQSEIEKKLTEIWSKHIGIDEIGILDNFFELGGHSLMAIRIMADIESTFGKEIPLATLFQATTIQSLAEYIQQGDSTIKFETLVPIQTKGSKPPLFCVPPAASTAMRFEKLSKYLGKDQPIYGFDYPGMDGRNEPIDKVPALAKEFINELILVQPQGPYYLCGMCYGAIVAFEIAQQLIQEDRQVALLAVIDPNFAPRLRKPYQYYHHKFLQFIKKQILRKKTLPYEFLMTRRANTNFETGYLNENVNRVFLANVLARLAYTSTTYPGKIVKFSTENMFSDRATKAWRKVTSAELEDHKIPGKHLPRYPEETGIMDEPNVEIFAQIFNQSLKQAQGKE